MHSLRPRAPDGRFSVRARAISISLLRPGRHRRRALHYRPLVLAGSLHAIAIGLRAFPGAAEAVLAELPGAFALGTRFSNRLSRHFAVGGEDHLVLDCRGRSGERLTVEERGLDLI